MATEICYRQNSPHVRIYVKTACRARYFVKADGFTPTAHSMLHLQWSSMQMLRITKQYYRNPFNTSERVAYCCVQRAPTNTFSLMEPSFILLPNKRHAMRAPSETGRMDNKDQLPFFKETAGGTPPRTNICPP